MRLARAVPAYLFALAATALGCGSSSPGAADGGAGEDARADRKADAKGSRGSHTDAKSSGSDAATGPQDAAGDSASHADAGKTGGSGSGDASAARDASSGSGGSSGSDASSAYQNVDAAAPSNDKCTSATSIVITGTAAHMDVATTTLGATHDVDAPCVSDHGADVFYKFGVSRRVFVYADTFGTPWNTVLFLLSSDCTAMTESTTPGDAVCDDDACGKPESQVAALLEPGDYVLGLSGRGNEAGSATIHFEFALAGGGASNPLSQGNTVQTGSTSGSSNITDVSSSCIAAGPEDSFWWANCPADPGGNLAASTCGGATWETVLELEIPQSNPYACSLDACDLQTTINASIPAGAGLRVLSVDGEGGGDEGSYTLTAARP